MDTPLQVTLRGFAHTPALDTLIRELAAGLEPLASHRMTACHVVVELGHERAAPTFQARIDLAIPGGVIAVNRELHDNAYVAVRDAFDVARHKLEAWERRHHGET